ncbi:hypothetical protein F183_A03030 [Bryobacterales bacterium F-183]|nr:hypothetical protein F183_A03030 [Bryobacterales bacterium F-183]
MHTPEGSNSSSRLDGAHDLTDQELTELFQALKAPPDLAPRPGFYARVMDRVEAQQKSSIWSVFLEPVFSRRLAFASLAMMLLMGFALLNDNGPDPEFGEMALDANNPPIMLMGEDGAAPAIGTPAPSMARHGVAALHHTQPVSLMAPDEGRELVLVDLVSYHE